MSQESFWYAVDWVECCEILHNLCIDDWIDNEWLRLAEDESDDDNGDDMGYDRRNGVEKRNALMLIANTL